MLSRIKTFIKRLSIASKWPFEALLGFVLIHFYAELMVGDFTFSDYQIHPYWIIILLMVSRYGFLAGMTCAFIAAAQYIYFTGGGWVTRSGFEQLIEEGHIFLPVSFVICAAVLGEIRQKYIHKQRETDAQLAESRDHLNSSRKALDASEKAKRAIESRIVGETKTVKTLYESALKLEALDVNEIYSGFLEILKDYFEVSKASVYILDADDWVLKATIGWAEGNAAEGRISKENSLMKDVIARNTTLTVKDMIRSKDSYKYLEKNEQPLAMIPVRNKKAAVIGVVNIEQMDFLSLNTANLNLMELLVEWAARALRNVEYYENMRKKVISDEDDDILSFYYLKRRIEEECLRAEEFKYKLSVAAVKVARFGFLSKENQDIILKMVQSSIRRYLHVTDLVFKYKFDGVFIVISPMYSAADLSGAGTVFEKELGDLLKEADESSNLNIQIGIAEFKPGQTGTDLIDKSLQTVSKGVGA